MHILAEARSHDALFRQQIIETWQAAFTRSAQRLSNRQGQNGSVTFGSGPTYEAFALDEKQPVVQAVLQAAKKCDIDAQLVSNNGGLDANWIVAHGIPAVTMGVGQRDVHMPAEWIDLEDFEKACRLIVALATIVPE